eukprot:2944484-Rhodomonas_salina.1
MEPLVRHTPVYPGIKGWDPAVQNGSAPGTTMRVVSNVTVPRVPDLVLPGVPSPVLVSKN